jgi:hypothetical protein
MSQQKEIEIKLEGSPGNVGNSPSPGGSRSQISDSLSLGAAASIFGLAFLGA